MSGFVILGTSKRPKEPKMSDILTVNTNERQQLQMMKHLKQGKTAMVRAIAALGLSEPIYRVLDRY
jgi:hypothetical protein